MVFKIVKEGWKQEYVGNKGMPHNDWNSKKKQKLLNKGNNHNERKKEMLYRGNNHCPGSKIPTDLRCNLIADFAPQGLHTGMFEFVHSRPKHDGASQRMPK